MSADTISPRRSKTATDTVQPTDALKTTLAEAKESISHMSGESLAMAKDGLAATLACSAELTRLAGDFNKTQMEMWRGSAETFASVSRDAFSCRTPDDMLALQKRVSEQMAATMEATRKAYGGLFEGYAKAMEPFVASTAFAPQRLFRAMAD